MGPIFEEMQMLSYSPIETHVNNTFEHIWNPAWATLQPISAIFKTNGISKCVYRVYNVEVLKQSLKCATIAAIWHLVWDYVETIC